MQPNAINLKLILSGGLIENVFASYPDGIVSKCTFVKHYTEKLLQYEDADNNVVDALH